MPTKTDVWVQEITGIHHYIDDANNVYTHEDIILNKINPRIIGKCGKTEDGTYYMLNLIYNEITL